MLENRWRGPILPDLPTGWQPIATAPKDGTEFLGICCPGDESYWVLKADENGAYYDDGTGNVYVPCTTHWMPLPEPPPK